MPTPASRLFQHRSSAQLSVPHTHGAAYLLIRYSHDQRTGKHREVHPLLVMTCIGNSAGNAAQAHQQSKVCACDSSLHNHQQVRGPVRGQRSRTHPQPHCCLRRGTSAAARTRRSGWCLQRGTLVSCITRASPELAPAPSTTPGSHVQASRTSAFSRGAFLRRGNSSGDLNLVEFRVDGRIIPPVKLLLPSSRTARLGQAAASSLGSVPVMELFRIAKSLRLLRLAHAASGSVPACKHLLPSVPGRRV